MNLNKDYCHGYFAGLRLAAAIVKSMSRSKESSRFAEAILKRSNHDDLIIEQWRRKGVL